ncbi:hypothetical protein ZIOFF_001908 [Zingiber officinale]|uniref:Nascent polypeptide-associated complex subunit beta n=1 Tax=Zingiber officinale TaxID=94328 RepID=A0A8J5M933_ZINOF|nr:hypothetical protein ZIOFF_001908 [Zingiber officinale]
MKSSEHGELFTHAKLPEKQLRDVAMKCQLIAVQDNINLFYQVRENIGNILTSMSVNPGIISQMASVAVSIDDNVFQSILPPAIQMNREKLIKMAGVVRTGGKGIFTNYFTSKIQSRKKKAVHKSPTTHDKKLQSSLRRIGVNTIPAIEEVNIFKDDVVIQFLNPKVQASIPANTWVVSGSPQTKKLEYLLPTVINQLIKPSL